VIIKFRLETIFSAPSALGRKRFVKPENRERPMRKITLIFLMAALLPTLFISAEKNPLKIRKKLPARLEIDLSVEPAVAPSDELNVGELQLKRQELQGKVIELTFDRVIDLKQAGGGYTARLTFESGRQRESVLVLIPEEGLELFQEMADRFPRSPLRETVYVEVISANVTRAVGIRFSKNKPQGERYSW
jgi:hypothetical protein